MNAAVQNTSISTRSTTKGSFNIIDVYKRLLSEDGDLTMPVAAIKALTLGLAQLPTNTVAEMLDLVSQLTSDLKMGIPNWISLSAGTDLFQRYLITNLQGPTARGDFEQLRTHLVQNGELFGDRAKAARQTIASFGKHFIHDGNIVLTNGGSRVVGSLLTSAADASDASGTGSIRFKVIYVVSPDTDEAESQENIAALRAKDIPVSVVPPTAIAYCMHMVTSCFVGAEGVVENGGIISRLGTYQMGMLANATGKPFYVVSESHKFVRLHPLGQDDLGIQQSIIDFKTDKSEAIEPSQDEGVADLEHTKSPALRCSKAEAVDYTPPNLISGIITESGVLLPSAVSEELIKIWF